MDWKTLVMVLVGIAVVIAVAMETLKRFAKKRKELPVWLQILIPGILSAGLSWAVWSALSLPGSWQILIVYSMAVFLAQYYLSMEIVKRVGKALIKWFLKSKGMTPEEIEEAIGG